MLHFHAAVQSVICPPEWYLEEEEAASEDVFQRGVTPGVAIELMGGKFLIGLHIDQLHVCTALANPSAICLVLCVMCDVSHCF